MLEKLTQLIYEINQYLRRAQAAVEDGDETVAKDLIADIAHIAATTDTTEENHGYTDLSKSKK